MICKLLIFLLGVGGVASSQWVPRKFEDYPEVVRYHNCDPCRVQPGSYNNLLETGIRNDSAEFQCWLWSLTGRSQRLVNRMLAMLPIELEFCQDFSFASILEVNFSTPLNFSNDQLNLLYKVMFCY